jgi:hypothetical protein
MIADQEADVKKTPSPYHVSACDAIFANLNIGEEGKTTVKFKVAASHMEYAAQLLYFVRKRAVLGLQYRESEDPEDAGYRRVHKVEVGSGCFGGLNFKDGGESVFTFKALDRDLSEKIKAKTHELRGKNVRIYLLVRKDGLEENDE